jgi:hypothetical protein
LSGGEPHGSNEWVVKRRSNRHALRNTEGQEEVVLCWRSASVGYGDCTEHLT